MNLLNKLRKVRTLDEILRFAEAFWAWLKAGCRYNTDEVAEERLRICMGCPEVQMDHKVPRCGQCGCWLGTAKGFDRSFSKIYYPAEQCPLGKWEK